MINPVNSISFKAVYEPENVIYSDVQNQILKDITQLNKLQPRRDFLVKPIGKDSVDLFLLKDVDKSCKEITSDNIVGKVRRFNKQNPLRKDDITAIKDMANASLYQLWGYLATACTLFACLFLSSPKQTIPKIEEMTTFAKDSAQTVAKDSVQNFAKDSLKLFK